MRLRSIAYSSLNATNFRASIAPSNRGKLQKMTANISEIEMPRTYSLLGVATMLFGVIIYTSANGFMTGGLAVAGRQLGLSELQTGLILGGGALIGVIAAPFWGFVSEILSPRKILLVAVPMVTLGPAAMAVIVGQWILLPASIVGIALGVARLIQAVFGAALIPVAQASMAHYTLPSRRVSGMGSLSAVVSAGTFVGSALLWLTGKYGVVSGFATIAVFGVLASVCAAVFLPTTGAQTAISKGESVVPVQKILPYLLITLVGFTCYTTVPPIFALRLIDKFGFDSGSAASQTGLVLTVGVIAVCAVQVLIATRRNWKPTLMLQFGSIGIFIGLIMLLPANDTFEMCLAMAIIGLAVGFLAPAILGAISLLGGKGAQGKIGGLNMAARGLGSAIGPVVGTTLYQHNPDSPIIGSLFLIAGVLFLTFILPKVNAN